MNPAIRDYLSFAEEHERIDYADKRSVSAGNKAADAMRQLAEEKIVKSELLDLIALEHSASLWAAHHLLETKEFTEKEEAMAISRIEIESKKEGVRAMGERYYLQDYLNQK